MSTSMEPQRTVSSAASTHPQIEHLTDELRGVYLQRLRRLLQLRKNHEGRLNPEGIRLLDRSIYATYCDCVSVGSLEAAQEIVQRSKVNLSGRHPDSEDWQ